MHRYALITLCLFFQGTHPALLYIKNWGSHPVTITEADETNQTLHTDISVQPGQTVQITHTSNGNIYTNFHRIIIDFNVQDYRKTEEIFFPRDAHATTTLSFTDSGYKRYPYNNTEKEIQKN